MKLLELAQLLGAEVEGDPHLAVSRLATLATAVAGDLAFLTDSRYAPQLGATAATAVLLDRKTQGAPCAVLRVDDPHVAYARALEILTPAWRPQPGVHPTAAIDATAQIGAQCHIGAFAVIGADCVIGERCVIHPHAVLYPNVTVGDDALIHAHAVIREGTCLGARVVLQPGVVLGGDGYGFARRNDGSYAKIPQVGTLQLDDDVEVQANSCIDRASLETSRVGAGTKIDNLVQIGHNCAIGANVLICSQAGVAGSTIIEDGAVLAGQVGVAGHCRVGKGAVITAQSGTHGDLEDGKMYSGSPAYEHGQWLRTSSLLPRLTELFRSVRELAHRLDKLEPKA